jgi:Mg-chelatase subunit ChlD
MEGDSTRGEPSSEAKRKLDNLARARDALRERLAQEIADSAAPTPAAVEIVDVAEPRPANGPAFGEKIVSTLSGNVKRSTRVAVEKDVSDVNALGLGQGAASYDPQFKQTELEKIRSKTVLDKVIDQLKLNEGWGDKRGGRPLNEAETYELLSKKVDARPVGDTSLIDISVKSDNPEEAARIANTIAEVYRDHRLEESRDLKRREVERFKSKLAEEEMKIASLVEQVERPKPEAKAPVPDEDRAAPRPAPAPVPQPEIQTSDNGFSTFSLNVSDVSFKLAAASLEKGQMPESGSVRSEEFINAFDYRDPEPAAKAALGFAWERASYPFAHNRELLRLSVKTAAQGRHAGRPLNLVLAIDNSGSMERADRVRIVREALRVLAAQLKPADKFSVITFARTARLIADGVPGSQAAEVTERIVGLAPQGGTNLEDAMNLAYATAKRHYLAQGINRVVILTDGAANLGNVDPELLKQSVEAHRKQGIALDCFGIGWEGYNDDLLEVLSRNGDGRYGFVNSPEEASTQFVNQLAGALKVAASDVKVQVEFNPRRVTVYRQIGYARHQLTKEQFRDNTVDAAEIGAAEAGNALYVIQVNPRGEGSICAVRVRYKIPGTADYREHSWDVPFTGNALALEHSSPAMRLTATASAFSEWLASSPYAAEVTTDRLVGYLNGVPEVFGADPRPKKLEWMIRQAKSLSGK